MELNKTQIRIIAGLIVFAITLMYALNNFDTIMGILGFFYNLIFPFILGGCIAFILNIPMKVYEKRLKKLKAGKVLSLLLAYITIFLLIGLVIGIVTPQIVDTLQVLPYTFQTGIEKFQEWIKSLQWVSDDIVKYIEDLEINWPSILNSVKSVIFSGASSMITSTIGVATTVAAGVLNLFIGIVFSIYILLQKETLGIQCKKLLYAFLQKGIADKVIKIAKMTSETFAGFFTGQCTEAVILGILFFVSMSIFNFPYAMVISVLVACFSLIPMCGSLIGSIIGTFLILMVNPLQALAFVVLFIVVLQIEGNLIYPRVVGNSVGLPSMWVLVAVVVGAGVMGIAGMIIFIPTSSVLYSLLKRGVNSKLRRKGIDLNNNPEG